MFAIETDRWRVPHGFLLLALVPAALCAGLLLARRPVPRPVLTAAACILGVSLAMVSARLVGADSRIALGAPAALASAALCLRFPAGAMVVLVFLAAAFGSIEAFTGQTVGAFIDLAIAGLVIALVWRFLTGEREGRDIVPVGVALLVGYVAVSAIQVLVAPSIAVGLKAFHSAAWFVLAFAVVALAAWRLETYERIARGIVVVAALVGGYAVLRYAIGPAEVERVLAIQSAPVNTLIGGKLRLFGSFLSGHQLAAWCGVAIPFLAVVASSSRGRWRLLAAAAAVLCVVALFGTEVRAGLVGAIIGMFALGLRSVARSVPGVRLGTVVAATFALLAVGATAFVLIIPNQPDSRHRYTAVIAPGTDPAYRERTEKWSRLIADIERHPFGHGLGTAGGIQQKSGATITLGSEPIDNSYLYIAYQQGVWVAVLFAAGVLAVLVGIVHRAITTSDPRRATLAIASSGAFASFALILFTGDYVEGPTSLLGWLIGAFGIAAGGGRHINETAIPVETAAPAESQGGSEALPRLSDSAHAR